MKQSVLPFILASLALAGCQAVPYQETHYGFVRGGALTTEEYGFLEPYVRSQTWRTRTRVDLSQNAPVASWSYAFAPGFDPRSIKRMAIGPFGGTSPELASMGAALVPYLRTRLDDAGVTDALATDDPATRFTISGAVTLNRSGRDAEGKITARKVQVEARVRQGDRSVGAIQVNLVWSRRPSPVIPAPGALLIGSLLAQALEPSVGDDEAVERGIGLSVANPFYLVRRNGAPRGMSGTHENNSFEPIQATSTLSMPSGSRSTPRSTDTP